MLILAALLLGMQDQKSALLEKVKKTLEAERVVLLEKIEKILDEELGGAKQSLEQRWREKDKKLVDQAKKTDEEELQGMFQEAMSGLSGRDFEECIPAFKTIYYANPESNLAQIAAYNCACAYALDEKKTEALEWLELCLTRGFHKGQACGCHESRWEHLESDGDFDSIRDSKEWAALLKRFKPENR